MADPEALARSAAPAQICVVDDDSSVCRAVSRLLAVQGYAVRTFQCAEAFLEHDDAGADGCLILDIGMATLDGLTLQQMLIGRGNCPPIVFLTGRADVPMCVRAMKDGAVDFLTKPVDDEVLLAAVAHAVERSRSLRQAHALRLATESRLASLTPREREVLGHVIAGRLNKQIAADLGTSEKTIKVHRARGIRKMCVRSVAELVRVVERAFPCRADGGSWR
ncbi:response regulator transcription factor [Eleftheria terrae]|uniref:response regulator transcription factor n=1 Tax=Eleftheria terrae TaxID=1597781 RepID=UPI00263B582E|nr:response regulator [Eleftheria terrae]WKB55551.1 response regulator [Eleftheria terrae]